MTSTTASSFLKLECTPKCPLSSPNPNSLFSTTYLLPCVPFRRPNMTSLMHQVAVQVNEFSCGGIAIGTCFNHKMADTTSIISFLSSWAATMRQQDCGNENEVVIENDRKNDDLNDASLCFPAAELPPEFYTSMHENFWFTRGNYRTERFVFDAKALAALKVSAASDLQRLQKCGPSRMQALCGFIWKSAMAGTSAVLESPSPRTSLLCQAVNLRREAHKARVGNVVWWAIAAYNEGAATEEEKELPSLVEMLGESIGEVKDFFMKPLIGEEALEAIGGLLRLLEELYSVEEPEIYGCPSWVNMGLEEMDFGLGRPVWVGTFGEVGSEFRSFMVLKDETTKGSGIEAWLTLDEKVLATLTNDHNFLAFCSVNPPISMSVDDQKV